jgi:C-terminal processing protease CtpA/Prc
MSFLGVQLSDPNPEERTASNTNKGAILVLSVRGGPAFEADVLPGDLLIKVNDEDVLGLQNLIQNITENRGHLVEFEIIRAGKTIHKKIQLNN